MLLPLPLPLSAGDAVGAFLVPIGILDSVEHIVPRDPEPAHSSQSEHQDELVMCVREHAPMHSCLAVEVKESLSILYPKLG